jgi:hypothetical protein
MSKPKRFWSNDQIPASVRIGFWGLFGQRELEIGHFTGSLVY